MVLITVDASLTVRTPEANPPPFLGGLLHGLVESLLRSRARRAFEALVRASPKRYAVFAPPPGPVADRIRFGVSFHGDTAGLDTEVAAALKCARQLRAGPWRADLLNVEVTPIAVPDFGSGAVPLSGLRRDRVAIELVTPLKLTTSTKRQYGRRDEPPAFVSLLKSVASRIRALEPGWAQGLGLCSAKWIEVLARAERVALVANKTEPSNSWYFKRGQARPVPLWGLIGELEWSGETDAEALRVLAAGQWVGAGQSTALGQGMYRVIP